MERPRVDWSCLAAHPEGVTLSLKVSPNASRTQAGGLWLNRLRLRVQAPPVEGKANAAVVRWAADTFGVRTQDVELIQGSRGGEKVLLIRGITLAAAGSALAPPEEPTA
jgi:uncharacterized protein